MVYFFNKANFFIYIQIPIYWFFYIFQFLKSYYTTLPIH